MWEVDAISHGFFPMVNAELTISDAMQPFDYRERGLVAYAISGLTWEKKLKPLNFKDAPRAR